MIERKKIPGYSRYSASIDGLIFRDERVWNYLPGIVQSRKNSQGYLSVAITSDEGVSKKLNVHVLVAAAFIGERPQGMHVCHNNGDRLDNRSSNLRYGTPKSNYDDSVQHGTFTHGILHKKAKITDEEVLEIKKLVADCDITFKEIGNLYGISGAKVSAIADDKAWRHVGGVVENRLPSGNKKLNRSKVIEIRTRFFSGESKQSLAKEFSISDSNVHYIVKFKTWNKGDLCDMALYMVSA